jgi:hypothetical protein
MMDAWATFWGWLLVTVLVVFAVLSLAIAVGGFFDIKALLATIDARHKPTGQDTADDADGAG